MTSANAQMNSQGRVVIPAPIRREIGIEGPTDLVFTYEDGVLTVQTREMIVAAVQRVAAQYIEPGSSLVDELIAQRRAEAAREW